MYTTGKTLKCFQTEDQDLTLTSNRNIVRNVAGVTNTTHAMFTKYLSRQR